MRLDASNWETMRTIAHRYDLDKSLIRKLSLALESPDQKIDLVTLGCGTRIMSIKDVMAFFRALQIAANELDGRHWAYHPEPSRWFHSEDHQAVGQVLCEKLSLSRSTLQGAVNRGDVPSVVLAFGTRLVQPDDVKSWHKNYNVKVYKHKDGRSGTLSQWAKMTNIPAHVLHERVKAGKKIADAIEAVSK